MTLRERIGQVIFETDTKAARAFDVALLWAIVASVVSVVLDSVPSIRASYGSTLRWIEWAFTALFGVEYALRVWSARDRRRYVLGFYGVVDLVALLPAFLALAFGAGPYLVVLRALRLLRVFRVLKLLRYLSEARVLGDALLASRAKITVFLTFVLTVVLVVGAAMYLIEGPASGFDSIPISMYWAIVTLTTVGYGDVAPLTSWGRLLASALMILGYGVIAVPTGIVTTELVRAEDRRAAEARSADRGRPGVGTPSATEDPGDDRSDDPVVCPKCGAVGHAADARYCRRCGAELSPDEP
ncbi:MAG: ion transporter [Trueperaceae bacterium]